MKEYQTLDNGWHTDLSLDLSEDSYIALFSCYQYPDTLEGSKHCRKLVVKNKETNKIETISMLHNSVILFYYQQNYQHLHKIILDNPGDDNQWLGITFRLAKNYVTHMKGRPFLVSPDIDEPKLLTLATDEQKKEFYKLRGKENKSQ